MKIVSSLNNPAMKKLQIRNDGLELGTVHITLWENREYSSGITVSKTELLEALNAQEKPEPTFEFPTEFGSVISREVGDMTRFYFLNSKGYWIYENGVAFPLSQMKEFIKDEGKWTVLREGL